VTDAPGPAIELRFEHFADRVGGTFVATTLEGDHVVLRLTAAIERQAAPGVAPGFSLDFLIEPNDPPRPQQLFTIEHPDVGPRPIFLVPVARDRDAVVYQAVFSFLPAPGT
jgi:hypothetical protein